MDQLEIDPDKYTGEDGWFEIDARNALIAVHGDYKVGQNNSIMLLESLDKLDSEAYKLNLRYFDEETKQHRIRKTRWVLEWDIPAKVCTGKIKIRLPDLVWKSIGHLPVAYTEIQLEQALKLKSYNQVRLYELLRSRLYAGFWECPLVELREHFQLEDKAYPKFSHFKKSILDVCHTAMEATDIDFTYTTVRKFKAVELIIFKIFAREPKAELKPMPSSAYSADLITDLSALGIQHLDKYEAEGIQEPHWRAAIASESEPAKIITTARTLAKLVAATKHKAESKHKVENSIEANRGWWNANYRALLLEPFWHGDRPLFMKNPPSSVEVESFCWVGLEAVNFGRSDFQEYILSKVKQFEDKLNERTRK